MGAGFQKINGRLRVLMYLLIVYNNDFKSFTLPLDKGTILMKAQYLNNSPDEQLF